MVTWDEVRKLIEDILEEMGQTAVVSKESRLIEDLGFDSIALMDLLCGIEQQFHVDFTELDDFGNRFNACEQLWRGINELLGADGLL